MMINQERKIRLVNGSNIDNINSKKGLLFGYDCKICKNKGYIAQDRNGEIIYKECECVKIRNIQKIIKFSGLEAVIDKYNFDKYIAVEPWQKQILEKANNYLKSDDWFFFGGQVGSGKTHICTAIVYEKIKSGEKVVYIAWRDTSVNLKSHINDDIYAREIKKIKEASVLYIDDFFKSERGGSPTNSDINIAFEILNYRYNNSLPTIISSEKTINEIINIDEATGSRIFEKAKKYCVNINTDINKNYRLRGS